LRGERKASGAHRTAVKKPREKFRVERVERAIPRVRREKVLISLLSVEGEVVVFRRDVWTLRRKRGRAISTVRMATTST